jgi:hypothetical protein
MKIFRKTKEGTLYNKDLSLTQIANLLESDKGDADKMTLTWSKDWPSHHTWGYTMTYEKYMNQQRESQNIKLLEIGICDKRFPYASSKMWMTYFKDLDLYSLDNFWGDYLENKINDIKFLNDIGVNFIYADQGNFTDWNEIKKEIPNDFDFIVEDGSHWPNHMSISLWKSKDLLKSGGFYFMEDLQNPVTARGMFKYDNALLTENLIESQNNNKIILSFLNDQQNLDINDNYQLCEMILDRNKIQYLGVFRKK